MYFSNRFLLLRYSIDTGYRHNMIHGNRKMKAHGYSTMKKIDAFKPRQVCKLGVIYMTTCGRFVY